MPTSNVQRPTSNVQRSSGIDRFARNVVAAILLLAALAKFYVLPSVGSDLPTSALIAWEVFLAVWLISNVASSSLRKMAIATWCVFASFTFFRLMQGHEDCGCFGEFRVHPGAVLLVDLCCAVTMAFCSAGGVIVSGTRQAIVATTPPLLATTIAFSLVGYWQPDSQPVGKGVLEVQSFQGKKIIQLIPSNWPGERLPIEGYLDESSQRGLRSGVIDLIIVRSGCTKCRRLLEEKTTHVVGNTRFLDLDVNGQLSTSVMPIRLSSVDLEWRCPVPFLVQLEDGLVLRTQEL